MTISHDLQWELNISSTIKKDQQRTSCLRQQREYKLPGPMTVLCYKDISLFSPAHHQQLRCCHYTWTPGPKPQKPSADK